MTTPAEGEINCVSPASVAIDSPKSDDLSLGILQIPDCVKSKSCSINAVEDFPLDFVRPLTPFILVSRFCSFAWEFSHAILQPTVESRNKSFDFSL